MASPIATTSRVVLSTTFHAVSAARRTPICVCRTFGSSSLFRSSGDTNHKTSDGAAPAPAHRASRTESSAHGSSDSPLPPAAETKTGSDVHGTAVFPPPTSAAKATEAAANNMTEQTDKAQEIASATISSKADEGVATVNDTTSVPSKLAGGAAIPAPASVSKAPVHRLGYTADNLPTPVHPLLSTIIGLIQKDGKRAKAQRQVSDMLQQLTLVTNNTPLPILSAAIERASPLVRMQTRKAGGKSVQVPIPLNERQSRRKGIMAIVEASKKRNDTDFSARLAREVVAVVEGTSSVLQRKEELHKIALVNRANASVRI